MAEKSPLNRNIERLKQEQQELKAAKKRLQKELRNTERKRKRLRDRARQLTDEDLVSVLQMRGEKKTRDARGRGRGGSGQDRCPRRGGCGGARRVKGSSGICR